MKLRNACNTLVVLALWLGASAALADPPAQVGRLNYLSGTVSFAPADAPTEWVAAPINRPVTSGDRLWVDNDGRAEMRIGSTAIRMAALTSMDVLRLDEFGAQLRLAQGTLNVQLRRLDAGDSFEISTPSGAVLLTQPGSYRVNVDPAGATTAVLVRRGQADVLTGNAPYGVREGQLSFFTAQGQEAYAAPAPDEFDNWAFARDRQDERVVATRYVPQEMTGYEDLDQHGAWRTVPEYGAVWVPTTVAAGWAPYRQGHWVWISPWGWTWVDDAPWGFAPYHYGRWVWLGNHWGWSPGARVARPVYAPALVAFVGGANWSVSVGGGPAVGWVPLGWREPYIPWYRHSPNYVRNVNVTHVTNITVINHYTNVNNVNHIRYINRDVPSGTTVVGRDTFVSARRVQDATLNVPGHVLANARVAHEAPVAQPERGSLVATRPGARLPAAIAAREVVAATAPPAAIAPVVRGTRDGNPGRAEEHERRIRVIGTQQRSTGVAQPKAADAPPVATVAPPPPSVAPAAPATQAAPVTPATPSAVERRGPPREPRVNPAPPQAAAPAPAPVAPPVATIAPPPALATPATQASPVVPATPTAVETRGPPREPRATPAPAQAAVPAPAPAPAPVPPPVDVQAQQRQARQQADAQAQQQRQAQQEQQRQAHQQQQARLQAQKEQQHQLVQQRAQQLQQQRELQYQQAQQVDQQRQLKQQQQQAQRQAERAEKQRRPEAQPPQTPPAPQPPR